MAFIYRVYATFFFFFFFLYFLINKATISAQFCYCYLIAEVIVMAAVNKVISSRKVF